MVAGTRCGCQGGFLERTILMSQSQGGSSGNRRCAARLRDGGHAILHRPKPWNELGERSLLEQLKRTVRIAWLARVHGVSRPTFPPAWHRDESHARRWRSAPLIPLRVASSRNRGGSNYAASYAAGSRAARRISFRSRDNVLSIVDVRSQPCESVEIGPRSSGRRDNAMTAMRSTGDPAQIGSQLTSAITPTSSSSTMPICQI